VKLLSDSGQVGDQYKVCFPTKHKLCVYNMICNGAPSLEKDPLHVKYDLHNESRLQISSQGLTVFSGCCIVRSLSLSSFVVKTHLRAFVWGHNKQRNGCGHLPLTS